MPENSTIQVKFEYNTNPGDRERFQFERPPVYDVNGKVQQPPYQRRFASAEEVRRTLQVGGLRGNADREVWQEVFPDSA